MRTVLVNGSSRQLVDSSGHSPAGEPLPSDSRSPETHLKGRVCIDLDIDRQRITRFGTPAEIDDHVRVAVRALGSRAGGLMLKYGLYPGVPLENINALMDAMEKYASYFAD